MLDNIFLQVFAFIILLIMSAFFSGSEAAFFSIDKKKKSFKNKKKIIELLQKPRRLLIVLLTGNTIVNTTMAVLATFITSNISQMFELNITILIIFQTFILSVAIVLASEITPKIIAIQNSISFAKKVSLPIKILIFILSPIAVPLYTLTKFLSKILPGKKEKLFETEDEIKALANIGAKTGSIKYDESKMIKSALDFSSTIVKEIMVPRIDIIGININNSLSETINIIKKNNFSIYPCFSENLDNIKGFLYSKDVLPHLNKINKKIKISSLCRKVFFVPESKNIDQLLRDFQQKKESIAIVVDEYGGTAGLVTVEDIVEEIVGEIRDEFDKESPMILKLKKSNWLVDAKTPINILESELNISFNKDREFDTLGGFLFYEFGNIPTVGNFIEYHNLFFKIISMEGNRILKINIMKRGINEKN